MSHTTIELLNLSASTFSAAVLGCLAVLGYQDTNKSGLVNPWFVIFALCAAWSTLAIGVVNSGLIENTPRLGGLSQAFSGYLGPALFLFVHRLFLCPSC